MKSHRFGIVVFPGTNCDEDTYHVIRNVLHQNAEYIFHKDAADFVDFDCIVLPGGFSYGDYLRTGAIARFSSVMGSIKNFADGGGLVIGICNGFQILCEAGLLPGAFLPNVSMQFRCQDTYVRVENNHTPFTNAFAAKQRICLPIAHGEGNYYCDQLTLKTLKRNSQIVFRYVNERGAATTGANPNGSIAHVAGIVNERGNVLGMMPHPERYSEGELGGTDGLLMWQSLIRFLKDSDTGVSFQCH